MYFRYTHHDFVLCCCTPLIMCRRVTTSYFHGQIELFSSPGHTKFTETSCYHDPVTPDAPLVYPCNHGSHSIGVETAKQLKGRINNRHLPGPRRWLLNFDS